MKRQIPNLFVGQRIYWGAFIFAAVALALFVFFLSGNGTLLERALSSVVCGVIAVIVAIGMGIL